MPELPAARDHDQDRDRHGFRGTPPPASFDLEALPDSTLLTEQETAAVGRWSTNTLGAWRRQPNHPLKWELVAGKFVRYRVGDVKRYLAPPEKRRADQPTLAPSADLDAEHPRVRAKCQAATESQP